jgi:hypothetical protein
MRFFRITGLLSRLLPALLLAFALCWQAGIVRAHVHDTAGWSVPPHAHHAPGHGGDDQDCPLCADVATASAYLASSGPALALPAPMRRWHQPTSVDTAAHPQRSHAWRSRAPPVLRTA